MYAPHRGRIPAIFSLLCAAILAAIPSASALETPEAPTAIAAMRISETASINLLQTDRHSAEPDVQWMLKDDRQLLFPGVSLNDHFPASQDSIADAGLSNSRAKLPHVDLPVSAPVSTEVNDKLVPVPVLSVGSAIVLCAVLFNIGARVLRLRGATA